MMVKFCAVALRSTSELAFLPPPCTLTATTTTTNGTIATIQSSLVGTFTFTTVSCRLLLDLCMGPMRVCLRSRHTFFLFHRALSLYNIRVRSQIFPTTIVSCGKFNLTRVKSVLISVVYVELLIVSTVDLQKDLCAHKMIKFCKCVLL